VIDRSLARQESCYSTPSSLRFKLDSEKKKPGKLSPVSKASPLRCGYITARRRWPRKSDVIHVHLLSRQQTLQNGSENVRRWRSKSTANLTQHL